MNNKKGFTLIEILVVVVIVGVLAAVAIPGYMRSVEKGRATEAMRALSDISKAENDYFYNKNAYTDDFDDLVIAVFDGARGDTHQAEYFNYKLEDDTATAERNGVDAPYRLYRTYDNPITYCLPAGNKYCAMLGLPIGVENSPVGRWQSCDSYPCTKTCSREITIGFTCEGTYNEDGTFAEKVCDNNMGQERQICTISRYNAEEDVLTRGICFVYDNDYCAIGKYLVYDENNRKILDINCTAWDESGVCTEPGSGNSMSYDANDRQIRSSFCENPDLSTNSCDETPTFYTYDGNGRLKSSRQCNYEEEGVCMEYGEGRAYSYDAYGNKLTDRQCDIWDENGNCTSLSGEGTSYTYNTSGKLISQISCSEWDENGNCTNPQDGIKNFYDNNQNIIRRLSECYQWDGNNCVEYEGQDMTVFEYSNGKLISTYSCYSDGNGNCADWDTDGQPDRSQGQVYYYDTHGKQILVRNCSEWNSNGTSCENFDDSSTYATIYDSNGNKIYNGTCLSWDANYNCIEPDYTGTTVYAYDENSNLLASQFLP